METQNAKGEYLSMKHITKLVTVLFISLLSLPSWSETLIFPQTRIDQIKLYQTALKRLGCRPGKIDGQWGIGTRTAMRHVAAKLNLPFDVNFTEEERGLNEFIYLRLESASPIICSNFVSFDRFQDYNHEFVKGMGHCLKITPKTTQSAIDLANCTWDNDEYLLDKYSLHVIYDLAYDRYSAVFKLNKKSTVEYYSGLISKATHTNNVSHISMALYDSHTQKILRRLNIVVD